MPPFRVLCTGCHRGYVVEGFRDEFPDNGFGSMSDCPCCHPGRMTHEARHIDSQGHQTGTVIAVPSTSLLRTGVIPHMEGVDDLKEKLPLREEEDAPAYRVAHVDFHLTANDNVCATLKLVFPDMDAAQAFVKEITSKKATRRKPRTKVEKAAWWTGYVVAKLFWYSILALIVIMLLATAHKLGFPAP